MKNIPLRPMENVLIFGSMIKSGKLIAFAFLALSSLGCLEEAPCINIDTSSIIVEFRDAETGDLKTIPVDSVFFPQINADTLASTSLNTLELPLSSQHNQTEFQIFSDSVSGNLIVSYDKIPKLFSSECDVIMVFENQQLVSHSFDSLVFSNSEQPPYAKIYF